ncbi:MAG: arginine repressor, partial [Oscillospiraceae bacterium]
NRIIALVKEKPIVKPEALMEHLRNDGYNVTQATVSRDIRELNLVKSAGNGGYRYIVQNIDGKQIHKPSRFETIFRESVIKVDYAGNTVLVKCYSGMANAACELFDTMPWNGVVGTLSGDDTFFILMRTEDKAAEICEEIAKYIHK